jgi:hypothetical protein
LLRRLHQSLPAGGSAGDWKKDSKFHRFPPESCLDA